MNTLANITFSSNSLINSLAYLAILALIIWGIIAVIKSFGVPIHPVVRIIATVIIGIVLIVLLVRALGLVL